jgi:hypothetical protein
MSKTHPDVTRAATRMSQKRNASRAVRVRAIIRCASCASVVLLVAPTRLMSCVCVRIALWLPTLHAVKAWLHVTRGTRLRTPRSLFVGQRVQRMMRVCRGCSNHGGVIVVSMAAHVPGCEQCTFTQYTSRVFRSDRFQTQ